MSSDLVVILHSISFWQTPLVHLGSGVSSAVPTRIFSSKRFVNKRWLKELISSINDSISIDHSSNSSWRSFSVGMSRLISIECLSVHSSLEPSVKTVAFFGRSVVFFRRERCVHTDQIFQYLTTKCNWLQTSNCVSTSRPMSDLDENFYRAVSGTKVTFDRRMTFSSSSFQRQFLQDLIGNCSLAKKISTERGENDGRRVMHS